MTALEHLSLPSDQNASGRTLGDDEIALLSEAISSGTLTPTKGTFVKELERSWAETLGVGFAYACSSGTAAIHTAVAAIDPEPGDEIITTPITDMGALAPIVYQGAIPVFADVDPLTGNVTAGTIEDRISDRTRAIIVTHLFGNPCRMQPIVALAKERGIPIIEDSAQAFLARVEGRPVGAIGEIGCFSFQQGKHATTGEGGIVVTDDPAYADRMRKFINKAWDYGNPASDHTFLALNYRMSELQGAVALAQVRKLEDGVEKRIANAELLTKLIEDVPGVAAPVADATNVHSYWRYCLRIDDDVISGGAPAFGQALREYDVASAPRYIKKPAFECAVFRDQRTFGESRFPFTLARPEAVDYSVERYPGAYAALAHFLVLPWNERYEERHVRYLAECIAEAANGLMGGKR
jgi:dTDP-4-amino-4,6-dideoxygalactose transaminase